MKDLGIRFDGFASVVEMLEKADGPFRQKILANIRKRDPELARRIELNLRVKDESSSAALQRGQRVANVRNYGN